MSARPPRIWLATTGMSAHHGSELLVGWQWYQRLKARGPVTVLTAKLFDQNKFLPPEARADCLFIDTRAPTEAHFPAHPLLHLLRWWAGVRRELKRHARPGDRLLIVSAAVVWWTPPVLGLPIPRRDITYGPLGVNWIPGDVSRSADSLKRNARTALFAAVWRLAWPILPGRLSFRMPAAWLRRVAGLGYAFLNDCPDVELPPIPVASNAHAPHPRPYLVVHDTRPSKRFALSLRFAAEAAQRDARPVVVIGLPPERRAMAESICHSFGIRPELLPRLPRPDLLDLLAERRPTLVTLTTSEGVPSLLVEALCAGADVVTHEVGGIAWLTAVAADLERFTWDAKSLVRFRWTADSADRFSERAAAAFGRLVTSALA